MKNKFIVYMHKNKINNKIYIGCTSKTMNFRSGKNGCKYKIQKKFYNDVLRFGWDNFEHTILYNNLSKEEATTKEKQMIQKYDSIKNGYNTTKGGENNTLFFGSQLNIKISNLLKNELLKEAKSKGLSLNAYIRMILIERGK